MSASGGEAGLVGPGRGVIRRGVRGGCLSVVLAGAVVLLMAGVMKLADPAAFGSSLRSHGMLPASWATAAAWGVAALEVVAGVMGAWWVVVAGSLRSASLATCGVFLAFAVYAWAVALDPPAGAVSCGCGVRASPIEGSSGRWGLSAMNAGVACVLAVCGRGGGFGGRPAPARAVGV
ncbi:MAG: hypothetical protein HRU70_03100 [Phycisphaeraceae bacterium]|nr:MAG: hypothetical protein HRU70_03100 [Phycisphaeraceae bacterium]